MKLRFLLAILVFVPSVLSAQWKNVGNAEYNWGPFQVYAINLATETGTYQSGQFPLLLSFKFEKPVEGKAFAISLMKELEKISSDEVQTDHWLEVLQELFPDYSPNDLLSYVALSGNGYFIVNDRVLNYSFGDEFNRAFVNIWLGEKSNFKSLQPQLFGKEPSQHASEEFLPPIKSEVITEDGLDLQLPPNFQFFNLKQEKS